MSLSIRPISTEAALDLRHAVLWPDHPRDFSRVDQDDSARHFGAFQGDDLVCVVSLFNTPQGVQLRKFATLPQWQGQGIGSRMLRHVLDQFSDAPRIFLDARSEASGLYQRFGFRIYEDGVIKNGRPYCRMERLNQSVS